LFDDRNEKIPGQPHIFSEKFENIHGMDFFSNVCIMYQKLIYI